MTLRRALVAIFVIVMEMGLLKGESILELRSVENDFWDWRMSVAPTYSTYLGLYAYNDQMPSYNYSIFDTWKEKASSFLQRLNSIDMTSLSKADIVNYQVIRDVLQTYINGTRWAFYGSLNPVSFLSGIHVYSAPAMGNTNSRGDFENYLARLHAVQSQVDEIKACFRKAIDLGRTLHNVSIARVPDQIMDNKIEDDPTNSTFYTTLIKRLNTSLVTEDQREMLKTRGYQAVKAYIDAFRDLRSFISNEYLQHTRTEYGVYAWDPTGDYYRACLKWHLSFEMSPEDVHRKGLEEVERIHGEMLKIMRRLNHNGTVREFFNNLKTDARFYSSDEDKILKAYNDTLFKRINPKLTDYFRDIPDIPVRVRASDFDGLGGGYSQASESEPGEFVVNLFRPLDVPFFEMMALSLHESNPGHHLQHIYAIRADMAEFRKHSILSFFNPPNYFPWYSAYQEGWGLYAEYLGEEMGLYKDDYEMMGRYSYEVLRAVRLVVDTGLHYYRWSRDEAMEYMANYTAFATGSAANEIDRYITWPGQACAYKIGELKIKELRSTAETELGLKFNIRDFHYLVLHNGGVPLSVLESLVKEWIHQVKLQPTNHHSHAVSVNALSQLLVWTVVALRIFS